MTPYDDVVKRPEIQDIVLSNLIGMTVAVLSEKLSVSPQRAFELFYTSDTCRRLHDKATGLYLQGHLYIADEFIRENQE